MIKLRIEYCMLGIENSLSSYFRPALKESFWKTNFICMNYRPMNTSIRIQKNSIAFLSIPYLKLNFKSQSSAATQDAIGSGYRERNHHHALGKQKFSFKHTAGLRINLDRVIQPMSRNPNDGFAAEHYWAFHALGPGYFVINKIFF